MEEIKFNMNDSVKVKLTEFGVSVLKNKHEELVKTFPRALSSYKFNLKIDENGYYEAQLHDLFNQFGEHVYGLPFETNIILLK